MKKDGNPTLNHPVSLRDKTPAMNHAGSHDTWLAASARLFQRMALLGVSLAVLMTVSACSSGKPVSNVQVGSITFTDANGTPLKTPPGSLTAGQGVYVDVTLNDDLQQLGADWSVYCGSAPPPGTPVPPGQIQDETCGTFTPAHTISGPVPSFLSNGTGYVAFYVAPGAPPKNGTVTLYAAATSSPNKFSSVSLSIDGNPISVSLAPPPPGTLQTGASTQLRAVLNNDVSNAGVNWTVICGSSDCGSFKPTQTSSGVATTYTAPAIAPTGGTVQVTATSVTDPTKAASATISIM
jgi:hypothetical protein